MPTALHNAPSIPLPVPVRLARSAATANISGPGRRGQIRLQVSRNAINITIAIILIIAVTSVTVIKLKSRSDPKHSVPTPSTAGPSTETSEAADKWIAGAVSGDPVAQWNVASNYLLQKNYVEAEKWCRKAAQQGMAEAQAELGYAYCYGAGLPRDYAEAVKWNRKAAEQGNAMAQQNLGECFNFGYGVQENHTAAARWYQKAALQGNRPSELSLGWCYAVGWGVQADPVEAYKWFQLALKQKSERANLAKQFKEQIENVTKQLPPEQIEEADSWVAAFVPGKPVKEPPSESTEVVPFTDPAGVLPGWATFRSQFEVQIHRILKGERVVEEGKLYPTQVDDPQKEPVYFDVSVKNIGCQNEKHIFGMDFKLIDDSGYSYSDIQAHDYIQGEIWIGTTVRGGIAFAINKGAKPETLIFDTGLVRTLGAAAELPVATPLDEYNRAAATGEGTKVLAEANLKHVSIFQAPAIRP
jgi:hypothetical protein